MAAQVGGIIATLAIGVAADRGGREPTLAAAGAVLFVSALAAVWLWRRAGDQTIEPRLPAAPALEPAPSE
jgi:hypothetical protein